MFRRRPDGLHWSLRRGRRSACQSRASRLPSARMIHLALHCGSARSDCGAERDETPSSARDAERKKKPIARQSRFMVGATTYPFAVRSARCASWLQVCLTVTLDKKPLDTPPGRKPHGCSVLRRSYRHASLTALREPLSIPRSIPRSHLGWTWRGDGS